MEKLIEVLSNCCPTVDFKSESKLITDKLIDSMDLVAIISDLEDEFGVSIGMDKITPENFDSAEAILKLLESLS